MLPRKNLSLPIVALLPFCAAVDIIRCGTQSPPQALIDIVRSFAGSKKCIKAEPYFKPPNINVDAYIHIVVPSDGRKEEPPESKLKEQMDVLNKGYGPTGMQYILKGIDRTVNATWSNGDDQDSMKKTLRKGDYKTLNLYYLDRITASGLPPGAIILGQCTFPSTVTEKSAEFFNDGCRMLIPTLPGGVIPATAKAEFEGKTTVHEVGHWNGLFHTFMGGCSEILGGDLICDTPAETEVQRRPAPVDTGCPAGRDTCRNTTGPSFAGEDAIHNYMNYYDDSCMNQFTPGQIQHLQNMWAKFRKNSKV